MTLICEQTALPEVRLLTPDVFRDRRGFFLETYSQRRYGALGIEKTFVQDNYSHSVRGTVRGLHYQRRRPQAKLIGVLWGTIYDVAVDLRRGSPTWGRWVGQVLSEENRCQLYIPEGFAHGFAVLSESADVLYKCTDYYDPADDLGVRWSDPRIGVSWPVAEPLLSDKDSGLPLLRDIPPERLPGPCR